MEVDVEYCVWRVLVSSWDREEKGRGELTCVGEIDTGEEYERLEADHPEWSRKHDCDDVIQIRLLELERRNDALIACLFP